MQSHRFDQDLVILASPNRSAPQTPNHPKKQQQKSHQQIDVKMPINKKVNKLSLNIDNLQQKTLISEQVRIKGQQKIIYIKQCQHKHLSPYQIFQHYPYSKMQNYTFDDSALKNYQGQINASIVEDQKGIHLVQQYQKNKGSKYSMQQDTNNQFNGLSVSIFHNGNIFQGIYHNGKYCGLGYELQNNGNIYIGTFKQGLKQGHGTYYWFANNQAYVGEWQGGLPHGSGIYLAKDKYQGSFLNGLKFGFGQQSFSNGDKYIGQYVNSVADGYGQYFWQDGSIYKGDFKQGLRHGYGIWQDKHQQYKGYYRLDKKQGFGVYLWKNKQIYKGQFRDDFRQGYGQFYSITKQGLKVIYRGCWLKGKKYQEGKVDQHVVKQLHMFLQKSQQYDTQIQHNSARSKNKERVGHKNCIPKNSYPSHSVHKH